MLNRLRLGFFRELGQGVSAFLQLQDSRGWGEEGSSLTPLNPADMHQACVRIDHFAGPLFAIRIGRQELSFGSEHLVGAFDWEQNWISLLPISTDSA